MYVINTKLSCLCFSHTQGMQARATYEYLVLLDTTGWIFTCKGVFWVYVINTKLLCLRFSHSFVCPSDAKLVSRVTYKLNI